MVIRRSNTDQGNANEKDKVWPCVRSLNKDTFVLCSEDHKDAENTDDSEACIRYYIIEIRDTEQRMNVCEQMIGRGLRNRVNEKQAKQACA